MENTKSVTLVWEEESGVGNHTTEEEYSVGQTKETGGTLKQRWELKEIRINE